MKLNSYLVLLSLVFAFAANALAQDVSSAAEGAEKLHAQLREVQAKQEALRLRAQQLDEALKPENIERSLAGIGSTRPEELREQRRRELTIEKNGVLAQLRILEASQSRLESAIATADAHAYQQSARAISSKAKTSDQSGQPPSSDAQTSQGAQSTAASAEQMLAAPNAIQNAATNRWLLLAITSLVAALVIAATIVLLRRSAH